MLYGTVVEFFADKGFGFIRGDFGPDVFFHVSALGACRTPPQIEKGQAVKYEIEPLSSVPAERPRTAKDGKPQRRARLVELIDKLPGGSLEDETLRTTSTRHPRSKRKKPTWRQSQ